MVLLLRRVCVKCHVDKSVLAYTRDKRNPAGIDRYCRSCNRQRTYDHGWNRHRRYGLSREQFRQMVEDRSNKCDICGDVPRNVLHVDHDHSCCPEGNACGLCIRGLLCENCNRGLGMFKDKPEILHKAIGYLKGVS